MAIRFIRKDKDPVLRQKSKLVKKITPKVLEILDDMQETMLDANGLGLAAPQVGISKCLVVINLTPLELKEGEEQQEENNPEQPRVLKLINPEIQQVEGEVVGIEGCLSFPGLYGEVPRPARVEVKALNEDGKGIRIKGDGMLARALSHEIDHLNGVLFIDKVTRFVNLEQQEQ